MNRFTATNTSEAVVPADRAAIWAVLTDPVMLPRLTPFLHHISADGDLWRWELTNIPVLGAAITPCFTERMVFADLERIDFSHEPPSGTHERTGASGWYVLSDVDGGTHLAISLTLHAELPLPRVADKAVTRVMQGVMERMGDRFAANLLRHLGVPAA